ncbi:MAG TPA: acyl-CoA-binding protein [Candidatus Hydrogenedentes bacterium]|nr:acyl-CoA-binding protein [Candidatus Hydrogenedentota bacterium]HOJ67237.1 acyl-CoA-binding protein [Candidatus Hydrogenedentota bacterium]HOK89732.1 acyl-CoA-binding protein [Candidatus Hydrogenedentota bacterium]HOV59825.1 acyl-CoA-binding protein [Candidatus Hydrogenedentota bacterium]
MSDLDARFQQASVEVTQLSQAPDNLAKLKLYALYKQATVGDCTGDRPGMLDFVGRAKYDAWKELAGMSLDEAKEKYIALVEELKAADKK